MTRGRAVAIILGFAGILVILQPGVSIVQPAALIVLAAAMGYGTAHTATKQLTRTDSPLTILLYMNVIQLPLGLVPALFQWTAPVWTDTPWLFLIGATGLTAHYCLARAFVLADAIIVIPLDFMRLPLITLVGLAVYAERFELATLAGAVMIFAGNYYSIYAENRAKRDKQAPGGRRA